MNEPSSDELTRLRNLGLYFHNVADQRALICQACGYALQAGNDRVSRHLGENHGVAKEARRGINQLVRRLRLPDPKTLAPKRDWSYYHTRTSPPTQVSSAGAVPTEY